MPSDVYSMAIHYQIGPQPGLNVLHFRSKEEEATTSPDSEAEALTLGWIEEREPLLAACLPSTVAIAGYKTRRINNGGGPTYVRVSGTTGTRNGNFSSSGIGPCIIWSYQKGGGNGGWAAGRTFLPAISENDIEKNKISGLLLEELGNLTLPLTSSPAVEGSGEESGWDLVIYSPTHETSSGVEAATISGKPGVQNRRMKPTF